MTTIVFCGPTISAERVKQEFDAETRPPARRGDLLAVAMEARPDAILLIDGYFDRVQSTWHKEILWAMSHGCHVFGSSSMGALRAAELAAFGMVGIGEIYDAFRSGELEDDDEVAITHSEADTAYRHTSDAMVDIRWTLRAAERNGVIKPATRANLEAKAKALPFYERSFRALLRDAAADTRHETTALRDWLATGRVDQKKADAITALRYLARLQQDGWKPKRVDFGLADTDGFAGLRREVAAAVGHQRIRGIATTLEHELCARGLLGRSLFAGMTRHLAEERLRTARVELNARAVEASIDEFRRERELFSPESFDDWIEQSRLDEPSLESFFRRDAVLRATRAELRSMIGAAVEDELQATGQLGEIVATSARKEAELARMGLSSPTLEQLGITEAALWTWFFCQRLGIDVPASVSTYAAEEGTTVETLRTAALREHAFVVTTKANAKARG